MLSCKEVTQLASDRLDRELPFWQRLRLRVHLVICKHCRRYVDQLQRLAQLARGYPDKLGTLLDDETAGLSEQSRERLRRLVDDELQKK